VKATKVNAGLAESNGRLLLGMWCDSLHVTCGLTACTPGSAPGPTLGNEYGKTLPFFTYKGNEGKGNERAKGEGKERGEREGKKRGKLRGSGGKRGVDLAWPDLYIA